MVTVEVNGRKRHYRRGDSFHIEIRQTGTYLCVSESHGAKAHGVRAQFPIPFGVQLVSETHAVVLSQEDTQ